MKRMISGLKVVVILCASVAFLAGCSGSAEVKPDSDAVQGSSAQFMKAKAAYLAYDFVVAFPLMLKEAEAGNPEAQYAVGYMYFYGQGAGVNYEESLKWIRKAAELGNSKAFKALAIVNAERNKQKNAQQQRAK